MDEKNIGLMMIIFCFMCIAFQPAIATESSENCIVNNDFSNMVLTWKNHTYGIDATNAFDGYVVMFFFAEEQQQPTNGNCSLEGFSNQDNYLICQNKTYTLVGFTGCDQHMLVIFKKTNRLQK